MPLPDALILSTLIASAWTFLYAKADRIAAEARVRPAPRTSLPPLIRRMRILLASLRRGRRTG